MLTPPVWTRSSRYRLCRYPGSTVKILAIHPVWGYDRIQGALANLGHKISDSTVANILREHGIEPGDEVRCTSGKIACRERLGGMLRYYYRRAS
jgi:hypothetical protein